jgi:dynein heavy chain
MINTIDGLSCLNNVKIEGLEAIVVKYKSLVENVKKKNYDILDHRKADVTILIRFHQNFYYNLPCLKV